MNRPPLRLLILPGWNDSDDDHWQSQWLALHGEAYSMQRVEQNDWHRPLRGDWMMRLEDAVLASDEPVVLIAHSLACHLVAAWAAHSKHTQRVRSAFLVAPPDTERDEAPPQLHSWRPMVKQALPFAAIVLASSDDPYCSLECASRLARDWHADYLVLGDLGHINSASALGAWDQGWQLLGDLLRG